MRTCDMLTFLYYGFALWLVAPLVVECRVITSTGGLAWPDRYFSVGVYRARRTTNGVTSHNAKP